ncbi:MAG: ATP-binding protein [Candidatus Aenigmarchaeota archaeon]|nr:ATP-binding protein [Candidatus Aenigmarchaeota archaeon]
MPLSDIVVGRNLPDLKKYRTEGTIYLGRHIVGKGENAHLTNPVRMDVSRPHVMIICGKRGSGKSFSGGVIAEEILKLPDEIKNNISVLMIDTQGIFWSMKNPNERQLNLLEEWNLKPQRFDVEVYVPYGFEEKFKKEGIPYDKVFAIKPSELTVEDWALSFNISIIDPIGILMDRCITRLKKSGKNYSIRDIINEIKNDQESEKTERMALVNMFSSAEDWGIFSPEGVSVRDLIGPGKVSIIDVSFYSQVSAGWSVRTLLVGLIARKIMEIRTAARREEEITTIEGFRKMRVPITWLVIDEAHNFLPAEGKTASSDPLLSIIKQGREPGVSCVLITQRPNKLHEDAISQADLVLSHRLTAEQDLKALRNIMQTYLLFDIQQYLGDLPKEPGTAIILDDNSERIYPMKVRPRQSWHAGGTPIAIPEKKE